MRYAGKDNKKINRRGFLKLGFAAVVGSALLFLSAGCVGDDDDEDDDDDDGGRRRRRRRR